MSQSKKKDKVIIESELMTLTRQLVYNGSEVTIEKERYFLVRMKDLHNFIKALKKLK